MDNCPLVVGEARNALTEALQAASRYAVELADARIRLGMRDREIERLREGIREVGFLAGSEVLRAMCEDLLLGEDAIPP